MRYLLLPFFLIHLGFSTLPSLLALAKTKIKHLGILFLTTAFLLSQGYFLIKHFYNPPVKPTLPHSSNNTISNQLKELPHLEIDPKQADLEVEKLIILEEKQAQHRDILINLAVLSQVQNNVEQMETYSNQAKNLDPNHPLFSSL